MEFRDKHGMFHSTNTAVLLPCGEATGLDETRYANTYNRVHIAGKLGDCINGNCATCAYARHPSSGDLHGHTYCAHSRKG